MAGDVPGLACTGGIPGAGRIKSGSCDGIPHSGEPVSQALGSTFPWSSGKSKSIP